jgi:hypothetical protein
MSVVEQWGEREWSEWEEDQMKLESVLVRKAEALYALYDVLACSSKQKVVYYDDQLNHKGWPVRRFVSYREFNRNSFSQYQLEEICWLILTNDPSLEDLEWFIPGHGRSGIRSLIEDAGIIPAQVSTRYENLKRRRR